MVNTVPVSKYSRKQLYGNIDVGRKNAPKFSTPDLFDSPPARMPFVL